MYICNKLGDAGVVVDVDDMLGDIGEDDGHRDSRRRHQQWPRPFDRAYDGLDDDDDGGRDTQTNPPQQNVFGFISEWITSVSFMKGIN